MSREAGEPERPEHEPGWDEKVLRLNEQLRVRRLPYAFGGAIALNYHREPRSTLDIDLNIFLEPSEDQIVVAALQELYDVQGQAQALDELRRDGQTRTTWGSTFVDLFLANTDFHASMASRVEEQPFHDATITVLAIEDLLICKVLFDRPKDWIDIEAVTKTRAGQLDANYIRDWLARFVEPDDPRLVRVADLLGPSPHTP